MSSQNIMKNPFRHSPAHGFCRKIVDFDGNGVFKISVVVIGLCVVCNGVTLVKLLLLFGIITFEGILSSLESREIQHFCPSGHNPSGFKIA